MVNHQELFKKYKSYINQISKWNEIGVNKSSTELESYKIQLAVTQEEVKETLLGVLQNDEREIIDGIADTIVTAGYLAERFTPDSICKVEAYFNDLDLTDEPHFDQPNDLVFPLAVIFNTVFNAGINADDMGNNLHSPFEHYVVYKIYEIGHNIFGEKMDAYIAAVLESNDTKFISKEEYGDEQIDEHILHEINRASEKYKGEYEDIIAVRTVHEDKIYFVLRAKNGVGKILKPSTYVDPETILENVSAFR